MLVINAPAQLSVGAHTYKVLFNQVVYDDGHDATVQHKLQEIWIAPNQPDSRKMSCLLHEYLHIVCQVQRIEMSEDDMDRIAEGMADFLTKLNISFDWSQIPALEVRRE
jgi:Zn-dependent peptidase ImmA (M78 family)